MRKLRGSVASKAGKQQIGRESWFGDYRGIQYPGANTIPVTADWDAAHFRKPLRPHHGYVIKCKPMIMTMSINEGNMVPRQRRSRQSAKRGEVRAPTKPGQDAKGRGSECQSP